MPVRNPREARQHRRPPAAMVLVLVLALFALPARASGNPRILVLNSYQYGLLVPDGINRGILAALREGGRSLDSIFIEDLDLARSSGADHRAQAAALLRRKLAQRNIGVVIAEGPLAMDFLAREGRDLVPNVPAITLVCPGVGPASDPSRPILNITPGQDPAVALRIALQLFPDTRRVYVVTGANDTIQPLLAEAHSAFAPWAGRMAFEFTNQMSYEEMLARAGSLPAHSVTLFFPYFSDRLGRSFIPAEVVTRLCQVSNAPVFSALEVYLGLGIVGGSLQSPEELGRKAGRLGLDLLEGRTHLNTRLTTLPPPTHLLFDWRQLRRWRVDPARLPEASLIRYRPPTLWNQFRREVCAAVAVLVALLALVAALVRQNLSRRRAEASLLGSEARFRQLVEQAPEAIVVFDPQARSLVDANANAEQLFGCSREQLREFGIRPMLAEVQPDGRPVEVSFMDYCQRCLDGESVLYERAVRRQGGEDRLCEVRLVRLPSAGQPLLRASYIDITERKRDHDLVAHMNERLEQQVKERTAKLEATNQEIEAFNYSVSHDLRGPLRAIDGFSKVVLEEYGDRLGAEGRRYLDRVRQGAERMGQLIEDLLRLSRINRGELRRHPVDLGGAAAEILGELGRTEPGRTVHTRIAPDLTANADPQLVAIALENLLGNAWKYTRRQAEAEIEFGRVERDGEPVLFVRDNGVGFDMRYARRLFGAFQRLHSAEEFEGSGIGLAIVQRIVLRHGGRIWAEAEVDRGATFFFTLPN